MNVLLSLLKLIPYLAAGISVVHSDLSLADKKTAAQDALSIAVSAATAALPASQSELASSIGGIAETTMNSVLDALHPSTTTTNTTTSTVTAS